MSKNRLSQARLNIKSCPRVLPIMYQVPGNMCQVWVHPLLREENTAVERKNHRRKAYYYYHNQNLSSSSFSCNTASNLRAILHAIIIVARRTRVRGKSTRNFRPSIIWVMVIWPTEGKQVAKVRKTTGQTRSKQLT